jgi:hypothetical protein
MIIQGDHEQLEALCSAVSLYVQDLLQASAENFSASFATPTQSNPEGDEPESPDTSPSAFAVNPPQEMPSTNVYLEPSGNLTHKLFLGSLNNQTSSSVVQLSLLQLFDLATALDEYSTDLMTLPNLSSDHIEWNLPVWVSVAAVFVVAGGLTPLTWKYANNLRQQQQTATKVTPRIIKIAAQPSAVKPPINFPSSSNIGGTSPIPGTAISPPPALSFPNSTIPNIGRISPADPLSSLNPAVSKDLQVQLPGERTKPNPLAIVPRQNNLPLHSTLRNKISSVPPAAVPLDPEIAKAMSPGVMRDDDLPRQSSTSKKTSLSTQVATDSTLFDTPQISEARNYLKRRWLPPSGLSRTLEYSLIVGVDGSLERLLPLNQSARECVDISGIPEIGQSFVSPNKYGQNIRLRVVLSPDGKVQTFPESR